MSNQQGVVLQQPGKGDVAMSGFAQNQYGYSGSGGVPPAGAPGLEYLASIDTVNVHQVLHVLELLTGWEKNNEYQIQNAQNQQFMHAKEDTDCMNRQCCGNIRPLDITLSNMEGAPVIRVTRPLRCQGCLCPCCLQYLDIEYPPGQKVATIKEIWTCWVPKYEIVDVNDEVIYRIEGDCCYCKCCTDVNFRVTRPDGSDGGEIVKHWAGWSEVCGQVNNYSVNYAPNESPINKAILLGSTFLVDFMYFEVKNQ